MLCVLAVAALAAPAAAWAQGDNAPIFRRFSSPMARSETRMRMLEVPVLLRPQGDPQAKVMQDQGIGYTIAAFPFNRVFSSVGIHFARLRWAPSDPRFASVEVKTLGVHQDVNFWLWHRFVFSFGLGLGIMDSLAMDTSGGFEHNLLPYIPVRFGLDVDLGDTVFLGARLAFTPFFASGFEAGHGRVLVSLGWVY